VGLEHAWANDIVVKRKIMATGILMQYRLATLIDVRTPLAAPPTMGRAPMLVGWVHLVTSLARGSDPLRKECGNKLSDLSESLSSI